MKRSKRTGVIISLIMLIIMLGCSFISMSFIPVFIKQDTLMVDEIEDITLIPGHVNANYTIGFTPTSVCANNEYILVCSVQPLYVHVIYRNNLTLKQNVSGLITNLTRSNMITCSEDYAYLGGKSQNFGSGAGSICGWRIVKYSLPDFDYVCEYLNTSWNFPEYFIINNTYMYVCGSKETSTAGLIKLYLSNMTEACPTTVHDYGALNYNYKLALPPNEEWLYTSVGCKTVMGYIGQYYPSNITYHDLVAVAPGVTYYNMQHIIAPTNDIIISASASTASNPWPYIITCINSTLDIQWNLTWSGADYKGTTDLCDYNDTRFIEARYNGVISLRNTSNGLEDWNYSGFNASQINVCTRDRFMYVTGLVGSNYNLSNITIERIYVR